MTTRIAGWGRVPSALAVLRQPGTWAEALSATSGRVWIPRGLGRAYGDASLPEQDGGTVVLGTGLDRLLAFDEKTGDLTAEGGVSLAAIIAWAQPKGWFLPTTPGTKFVTLGGAVAADVHGKNHHANGSFGAHVRELTMLLADGTFRQISPTTDPRLFWATVGGMGLTGFILTVTVRLHAVPSAWYRVTYERAGDLQRALLRLAETDAEHRYSVAWIDCLASGASLGRSVLMLGNEAQPGELPARWRSQPMRIPSKGTKSVPFDFPDWALGSWSVKTFNQAFYWKHADCTKVVDYNTFFYPLDSIHAWNRIYGSRGFVQFQALFPDDTAAEGLRAVLEAISGARLASFLAVLKRSGPSGGGWLSYLHPGFTLALDIPHVGADLITLHRKLELLLLKYRGRLYFAKDTLGTAEAVAQMYPRLPEFRALKADYDPRGMIRSRLAQRLNLC